MKPFHVLLRRVLLEKGVRQEPDLTDDKLDVGEREALEKKMSLGSALDDNLKIIRDLVGPSSDLVVRQIKVGRDQVEVALLHIKGLSDGSQVSDLTRMLTLGTLETPVGAAPKQHILDEFREHLLHAPDSTVVKTLDDVWSGLVQGYTALIFDGTPRALLCNTQGYEKRTIDEPASETAIRGPREGFIESAETNLSLLRRRIKSPNLWVETLTLGHLTRTSVSIVYIKGLAGDELVKEVHQRVSRIEIDGILESGYIEELIEDNPLSVFPLVFRTERPDRVAAMLLEGRVAVITDGTPFVLVVPMTFPTLLTAPDDYYEKTPTGAFLGILRYLAFWASILVPGTYVGIITFHQELIPTTLALRIAAAKEGVPFPVVFEVFIMELIFEILREAGIRLPRAIGPAVSIVGALVLGDAAIRAGLVSPPVVIVVAFTAISSFTVPTFSFELAARLFRFIFIILGGTFGLFGVQFGFLALLISLSSLRSFGYPYLAPMAPFIAGDMKDTFIRTWWWDMVTRPKLLGSREPIRQARGQRPRPGLQEEGKQKDKGGKRPKWQRKE